MVTFDIDALRIAKWLQVAHDQRARALTKLEKDYGTQSAAAAEARNEIEDIKTAITIAIKTQADAPKRK